MRTSCTSGVLPIVSSMVLYAIANSLLSRKIPF
jgi:hypothetical protein